MASDPRATTKLDVDPDGVRILAARGVRRAVWLFGLALGIVTVTVVVAIVVIRREPARRAVEVAPRTASPRRSEEAVAAPASPAPAAPSATPARLRPVRRPAAGPAGGTSPSLNAKDVIPALVAAGETTGIAAFPLPGTKPVKRGLVVPDDFELPEGYVRHYQSTDDGERLPAILMFHPDYQLVDEHGEPVPIPEDRVVPPELAPAGLPIRLLDVPDPAADAKP